MARAFALILAGLLALPAAAQDTQPDASVQGPAPADPDRVLGAVEAQRPAGPTDTPMIASAILVLDQDRLLAQSRYGRRVQAELAAAAEALTQENREIEARLTQEELRLTELRPTMDPTEFAELAEDFDTRVEAIRTAQDAKSRDLQAQADAAQTRFFEIATPILLEVVRERGGAVLLDNRSVLLSAQGIDVTDFALARIDAEIGAGGADPLVSFEPGPAPAPAPTPEGTLPAQPDTTPEAD